MSVNGALNSRLHAECKGSGMPQETPSAHQPEKPTASIRILAPLLGSVADDADELFSSSGLETFGRGAAQAADPDHPGNVALQHQAAKQSKWSPISHWRANTISS